MNSSTSRISEKKKKNEEIKKQIEMLKAQLDKEEMDEEPKTKRPGQAVISLSDKKESLNAQGSGSVTLVPNTPSPRKKRKLSHSRPNFNSKTSSSRTKDTPKTSSTTSSLPSDRVILPPQPSTLFSTLLRLEHASAAAEGESDEKERAKGNRTVGFDEKPAKQIQDEEGRGYGTRRDERLALVEDFEMGPYQFTPPVDDPDFNNFEPHSGIVLSSRVLPHADLSDYLVGRFYISPSKLYSLLRPESLSGKGGGYDIDIPVPGDWVTIAVIAERGQIKYTKAPIGVDRDEEDKGKKRWHPGKDKVPTGEEEGRRGKKYVSLKLIDFGARSDSSGEGGYKPIRGDGFLNLILFEADGVDLIRKGNEKRCEKIYKGGSGGGFEKLMDVREGDVVALLNPRVLKPYQGAQTSVLAVTPPSASSIVIIGRSRDLGMCTVLKADGKVCGSWCDKRAVSAGSGGCVCEYHLERAVKRSRAGRNEFAIGTSGMSISATHKRKNEYDPHRKWGLNPSKGSNGGAEAGPGFGGTYVFAGHVVSNGNVTVTGKSDGGTMFLNEKMGREAQARAKRKMVDGKVKEGEEALVSRITGSNGKKRVNAKRDKGKVMGEMKKGLSEEDEEEENNVQTLSKVAKGKERQEDKERKGSGKALYSAHFIKSLGFDPSSNGKGTSKGKVNDSLQNKLDALESLSRNRSTNVQLGPRPGARVRSGVVVPPSATSTTLEDTNVGETMMIDLDDWDDT